MKKYVIIGSIIIISAVMFVIFNKLEDIPFELIETNSVEYQIQQALEEEEEEETQKLYNEKDVYKVIKSEEDLQSLKIVKDVNIDFKKNIVVFLTRGNRLQQPYDIELIKIRHKNSNLFVHVKKTNPEFGMAFAPQFEYKLYLIDKKLVEENMKVKFVEE